MRDGRDEHSQEILDSILLLRPRLGQDIFQMDSELWAVHGYVPVDGEVILAEFDHRETAAEILAQLAVAQEHSRTWH